MPGSLKVKEGSQRRVVASILGDTHHLGCWASSAEVSRIADILGTKGHPRLGESPVSPEPQQPVLDTTGHFSTGAPLAAATPEQASASWPWDQ